MFQIILLQSYFNEKRKIGEMAKFLYGVYLRVIFLIKYYLYK